MDLYNRDGLSVLLYIAMATNPKYKLNFLGMREIPGHVRRQILVTSGVDDMEKQQQGQRQEQECNVQLHANEPHIDEPMLPEPIAGSNNREYNDMIENDVSISFGRNDDDFEMLVGIEVDRFLCSKTTLKRAWKHFQQSQGCT